MATINCINQASEALVIGPIGVASPDPNTNLLVIEKNQDAQTGMSIVNSTSGTNSLAFLGISSNNASVAIAANSDLTTGNAKVVIYNVQGTNVDAQYQVPSGRNHYFQHASNGFRSLILGYAGSVWKANGTTTVSVDANGGQYRGYNSDTAPAAGYIGEVISSTITPGSHVTGFSNNVPFDLTTISLTPGIWDVWVIGTFATTGVIAGNQQYIAGYNTTSATLGTESDQWVQSGGTNAPINGNNSVSVVFPPTRVLISTNPTTIYAVLRWSSTGTFTNPNAYGKIYARRSA